MSISNEKYFLSDNNHYTKCPFEGVKIKNAKVTSDVIASLLYPGILDEETEDMTRYISEFEEEQ